MRRDCGKGQGGFTLAELMTVISIMSILMAIGMPLLMTWYRNTSVHVASRDLYSTLKLVQANAARRNLNCAISFNGANGYVAYVDANQNFKRDADEAELASYRWSSYPSVSVTAADITYPLNMDEEPTLAFRPNALPVTATGLPNGSVTVKSSTGRAFTVSSSISGNIGIKRY